MRGRKPLPKALKILRGEQPCRINDREPILAAAAVRNPPVWLGTFGRQFWRKHARMMADAGLLTVGDVSAFEMLCNAYDIVRRDPFDTAADDRFRRWSVEFGLTPSSRSRIKSTAAPPVDKMGEFLARQAKKGRAS